MKSINFPIQGHTLKLERRFFYEGGREQQGNKKDRVMKKQILTPQENDSPESAERGILASHLCQLRDEISLSRFRGLQFRINYY